MMPTIASTRLRTIAAAALSLLLAVPAAAQRPDRSRPPAVGPVPNLTLPQPQRFELSNGLPVLLVRKTTVPLVQVLLLLRAGSVRDSANKLGLASLTAAMLDDGADGRSALEISDAFESLGARFSAGGGDEISTVSLRVPVARHDAALDVMSDVVLRPEFPDDELARARAERITSLLRQRDQPNAIASVLFDRTLFGAAHPFGRTTIGDAATLGSITSADLLAFHRRHFTPGSSTLVVVGDIDAAAARTALEKAFGGWEKRAAVAEPKVAVPPQVTGMTIYLVDKPGAAQSIIDIGRIGAARATADYYALEVLNTILGGSFTSRLNQNLREDKGYTYGARSGFDYGSTTGAFSASAAVQTQSTGPALAEFMKELRGIREPIPAEELDRAKKFLANRYLQRFQSVAGVAGSLGDMVEYRLPADQLSRYPERVLAVTAADVARVARQYVDPANLAIIVVGDRAAVEQQIRQQDLGALRLLTVEDVLGPPPVPRND
jgi:predicted Zn-dependent peptidase